MKNQNKPEFIIEKTEDIIGGEKVEWSRSLQKQPHLIQIVHEKTNFVEKPIRVKAQLENRYKRVKDEKTGEMVKSNEIISKFVVFYCPETKLNYKHFNVTDELLLFLGNPHNDDWVLLCKGEVQDEPKKQQQLDENGKAVWVEVGRRDFFFINKIQVRRDGKLLKTSEEW